MDTGTCAMPQRCEGEAGMIWDPDLKVAMSFSSIHPAVFAVSLLCAGDGQYMWFNSCPPRSCGVVGKEGVGVNKLRLQTDRWAKEEEGNLGDLLQSYWVEKTSRKRAVSAETEDKMDRETGAKRKVSLRTLEQPHGSSWRTEVWMLLQAERHAMWLSIEMKREPQWQAFRRWVGAGTEMAMANAEASWLS